MAKIEVVRVKKVLIADKIGSYGSGQRLKGYAHWLIW